MKVPATVESLREQLARLGDTPFELGGVRIVRLEKVMVPKSVMNDLRRKAAVELIKAREAHVEIVEPDALATMRSEIAKPVGLASASGIVKRQEGVEQPEVSPANVALAKASPTLTVLVRTLDQLQAVCAWPQSLPVDFVYCDFEDIRKYSAAVAIAREHGLCIALATTRIIKPGEEGLLRKVADNRPDALLVRNLAGVSLYREEYADIPLIGDYALNVANEITADLFRAAGLIRLTPSYDLNWKQLATMLARIDPRLFECVIHQHMPMFHMEHCVFCHTLSNGHDYTDCGRPCDIHKVDLRDREGRAHPLIADVGCRNTVYNATAQSAIELVGKMRELGIGVFRIEMLREDAAGAVAMLNQYADALAGRAEPKAMTRSLRVLSQLGVTRGTFDYE
jgi:putative protease